MELKRIEIKNFRSIKDEKIEIKDNCIILIGKNEAGKSNVLKAIASVFEKYKLSSRDKRKKIENETILSSDYYIRAVIELSKADFLIIENKFRKKFNSSENIQFESGINLSKCINNVFYQILLRIDISEGQSPNFSYWRYTKDDIVLKNKVFIIGNDITLEGTKEFNLIAEIFTIVKEVYTENPINCHYWHFSDEYLLPSNIDINSFIKNPSSSLPLENIFALCNRGNIKEEFENAMSEDGDYSNLLEQVSKKVTSTFRKIWNDLKDTSIQLSPDGNLIQIKITDKVKYNCEDRSDGFKKFISILLMLSTRHRAKRLLNNDLILIDEPDQSLYPTSATFLRNELLTIAIKSKVIYSTHSQYMIDTNNIERHIIVEKKDDITSLKLADNKAPFSTDELIRRAIGSSIFECIQPVNIVFEGYLDKKLFNKYCEFNSLDSDFAYFGQIFLSGISGLDAVISILISANKKFIIVADSDDTSKNKKVEFQKSFPDYKDNWLSYADVVKEISTMEDFITSNFIESVLVRIKSDFKYNDKKTAIQNIELVTGGEKDKKQEQKKLIAENIKKEDLLNSYAEFASKLKSKLDEL